MRVFIEKENTTKTLRFSGTVASLLHTLHINSESVLVTKNNVLVVEQDTLRNSDAVRILSVISGG